MAFEAAKSVIPVLLLSMCEFWEEASRGEAKSMGGGDKSTEAGTTAGEDWSVETEDSWDEGMSEACDAFDAIERREAGESRKKAEGDSRDAAVGSED